MTVMQTEYSDYLNLNNHKNKRSNYIFNLNNDFNRQYLINSKDNTCSQFNHRQMRTDAFNCESSKGCRIQVASGFLMISKWALVSS